MIGITRSSMRCLTTATPAAPAAVTVVIPAIADATTDATLIFGALFQRAVIF